MYASYLVLRGDLKQPRVSQCSFFRLSTLQAMSHIINNNIIIEHSSTLPSCGLQHFFIVSQGYDVDSVPLHVVIGTIALLVVGLFEVKLRPIRGAKGVPCSKSTVTLTEIFKRTSSSPHDSGPSYNILR